MKKTALIFIGSLFLMSCSTSMTNRLPSSLENFERPNLAGEPGEVKSYLGVAKYVTLTSTGRSSLKDGAGIFCTVEKPCSHVKKKAIRLYLEGIDGEPNSYHAVLLEYAKSLEMLPKWAVNSASQGLSKRVGYLNNITDKISAHKIVPVQNHAGLYEILKPIVDGGEILFESYTPAKRLALNFDPRNQHPLEGARIEGFGNNLDMFFVGPDTEQVTLDGILFGIAYKALESTWHEDFIDDDYYAAYRKLDDVVLTLGYDKDGGAPTAIFKRSDVGRQMIADPNKGLEARQEIFTNPLSANLTGDYDVTEPINRMFLFSGRGVASDVPEGRIGLFIDVFNASNSPLKQAVVEIALINPNDSEDFLMYYQADPK